MPTCALCPRILYKYDEVIVDGKSYHSACFVCKNCKRAPPADDQFVEENKTILCSTCFLVKTNPNLVINDSGPPPLPETTTTAPVGVKTEAVPASKPRSITPAKSIARAGAGGMAAALLKHHRGETEPTTPAPAAISTPTPAPTPVKTSSIVAATPTPTRIAVTAPKCPVCTKSVYKVKYLLSIPSSRFK